MKKIKIVHLIGSLTKGGAERFLVDLCNELTKTPENEVFLLSLHTNDPFGSFLSELHPKVNYHSFDKAKGFSFKVLVQVNQWLKNEKPAIVHSHLNGFEYLSLYLLSNSKTLFFHTIHNVASAECNNYILKTWRKAWYASGKVKPVTVSLDGRKTYRDYYQLNNDTLIYNGRPNLTLSKARKQVIKTYRPTENTFLLVHTARITSQKNQELLIRSVKRFNTTAQKKCKLLLIGEVRDKKLYRKLQQIAGDDPNILFLGGIHNVVDYLSIADVFCLSSCYEGMPISLIEALSVGCIPVCTPVGGITEMIRHGYTGFLSKDSSIESYCQTLKEALYHPEKILIRLTCIQHFRKHYHISNSAKQHHTSYLSWLNTLNSSTYDTI